MTTQTQLSDKQLNALRGQAKRAGVSEAEWAAKAGGTSLEALTRAQIDQLFAISKGETPGDRSVANRDDYQGAAGGVVVPINIFPEGALARVIERYGVAGGEGAFRAWIAPEPYDPRDRLTDDEIMLGLQILEARGLSVVKKQGYLTKIKGKLTVMPAIAGLRAIAVRTGQYAGIDKPTWYDATGKAYAFWAPENPDDHPAACEVTVYRLVQGQRQPFTALVTWRSFGRAGTQNWDDRDDHQIEIVAERHALYKAFPEETEGLEDRPATEDELEAAARGALFAWMQTEGMGDDHSAPLRMLGLEGSSLAEAAANAGGWRELWRRLNQRVVGKPEARAALGEAVTLRLNPGAGPTEFWTEARRAGWDQERVLLEMGYASLDSLVVAAEREGWPQMEMGLRALVAKHAHMAAVDRTMPASARGATSRDLYAEGGDPLQQARERVVFEREGVIDGQTVTGDDDDPGPPEPPRAPGGRQDVPPGGSGPSESTTRAEAAVAGNAAASPSAPSTSGLASVAPEHGTGSPRPAAEPGSYEEFVQRGGLADPDGWAEDPPAPASDTPSDTASDTPSDTPPSGAQDGQDAAPNDSVEQPHAGAGCPVCGDPLAILGFDERGEELTGDFCATHQLEADLHNLPEEVINAATLVEYATVRKGLSRDDVLRAAKRAAPTWPKAPRGGAWSREDLATIWSKIPLSAPPHVEPQAVEALQGLGA